MTYGLSFRNHYQLGRASVSVRKGCLIRQGSQAWIDLSYVSVELNI